MSDNTFQKIFDRFEWTAIESCPGRYVFSQGVVTMPIIDLLGFSVPIQVEEFPNAVDMVHYCFFDGGGIISFQKTSGFLHTLGNESGMHRKLKMLRKDN